MLWGEETCRGWCPREYIGWGGPRAGGNGSNDPALLIKWAWSCWRWTPGCMLRAGLIAPAERWPYDPLALEDLDPLTMEASELGEKRIMELMSNESEYGDDESALFRDWRRLPGLGLFKREPRRKRQNVVIGRVWRRLPIFNLQAKKWREWKWGTHHQCWREIQYWPTWRMGVFPLGLGQSNILGINPNLEQKIW